MSQWTEIGMSLGIGAGAGIIDQVVMNQDEKKKREEAAQGNTLSMWKQIGTYYNYFVPAGIVVAAAAGALRGDWLNRLVTVAGQLIGRKATAQVSKVTQSAPWRPFSPGTRAAPQTTQPEFIGPEARIY